MIPDDIKRLLTKDNNILSEMLMAYINGYHGQECTNYIVTEREEAGMHNVLALLTTKGAWKGITHLLGVIERQAEALKFIAETPAEMETALYWIIGSKTYAREALTESAPYVKFLKEIE